MRTIQGIIRLLIVGVWAASFHGFRYSSAISQMITDVLCRQGEAGMKEGGRPSCEGEVPGYIVGTRGRHGTRGKYSASGQCRLFDEVSHTELQLGPLHRFKSANRPIGPCFSCSPPFAIAILPSLCTTFRHLSYYYYHHHHNNNNTPAIPTRIVAHSYDNFISLNTPSSPPAHWL